MVLDFGAAEENKTLLAQSVMIFMLCGGVMEMPAAVMVVIGQISVDSDHECGPMICFIGIDIVGGPGAFF